MTGVQTCALPISECDRGIAFDDESLNIDWILKKEELKLSDKDTKQPKLNETKDLFEFGIDYYARD